MAKVLTIDQVKKMKIVMEGKILKLVQDFEKETKSFVSYVSLDRRIGKGSEVCCPEPERDGPIANAEVSLRFDL